MPYIKSKLPEDECDELSNARTRYQVFGTQYKHGYPFFTIYKDGVWVTVSAKHFEPAN
jgi:hypothetical protein